MVIGERLKKFRESKQLSQGDVERRTGLLRCYISRVENGHTIPSIETLEKLASALETPMFRLFCEDDAEMAPGSNGKRPIDSDQDGEESEADKRYFREVRRLLTPAGPQDRRFFLNMARRLGSH